MEICDTGGVGVLVLLRFDGGTWVDGGGVSATPSALCCVDMVNFSFSLSLSLCANGCGCPARRSLRWRRGAAESRGWGEAHAGCNNAMAVIERASERVLAMAMERGNDAWCRDGIAFEMIVAGLSLGATNLASN